jgi:hypothetical protein
MTISVIYHYNRGETFRLAEAIAKRCGVEPIEISKAHVLPDTDLLFVGMSTDHGKPDDILMDYLDQLPVNKIRGAAIFSTHRNAQDRTALAVNLLEHKGITVFPERFVCLQPYLMRNKDRPNKDDVRNVLVFTERVLSSFNG